jgi:protein-disulfide isomerase
MSSKNKRLRAERAAALLAERERAEKRRRTLIVAGILLGLVLVIAAGFAVTRLRDTTGDVSDAVDTAGEYGVTIGQEDAPREVVIYEDFLCPACGAFEAETNDALTAMAEAGDVRVTYRPFTFLDRFGDYSERATAAFGVVLDREGAEVAKEFHDLLFENQPSEAGPFPDDDALVDLAVEAGADKDAVGDPIRDLAGEEFAAGATEAALDAGVQQTPTVLIDGEVYLGADLLGELE